MKDLILNLKNEINEFVQDTYFFEDEEEVQEELIQTLENSVKKVTEQVGKIFETLPLKQGEISLIKTNFISGGKVSLQILYDMGYLIIEDKESEDFEICLQKIKDNELKQSELLELVRRMEVARNRHINTNYDNFDKRNMSDDQVSELRQNFNK